MTHQAPTDNSTEALIGGFEPSRVLNQDQGGRRIILHGNIAQQPSILILERTVFPSSISDLSALTSRLEQVKKIGQNDIYVWYLASSSTIKSASSASSELDTTTSSSSSPLASSSWTTFADLKINLIHPCTETHVRKYSQQGYRVVTETPQIYRDRIRPYIQEQRGQGKLDWIWNVLEGRAEQEDILLRVHDPQEGFLLTPDLNWDRKTLSSMHLLVLVERRDIWSLRDLQKRHIPWLEHMRQKVLEATVQLYPELELDQIKLYMHYQPTYYHFHIHVVNVAREPDAGQAAGKAYGLENIIAQLRALGTATSQGDGGSDEKSELGMADIDITYTVGEASALWSDIFLPLKQQQ